MNTKMYVGNIPYEVNEEELREQFSAHGEVTEVFMVMDRETGRPKGFAFVTMESREGMEAAMRELDGTDFNGRTIKVNEARPREERTPFSGGGRGGFRGGGGGGGGGGRGGFRSGGGSRKGGRGRRGQSEGW